MLLPAEPRIRWTLSRAATLLELGAEPVRGLVLPTDEHFPDVFDGTPRAVSALLARTQKIAGLSDIEAEISFVTPEGEAAEGGGCGTGACGPTGKMEARLDRVGRRSDGSYVIAIGTGEVRDPVVLTTALVRSVACMFMTEAGAYESMPSVDREPVTDLAGVMLGFGVLLANGSHVVVKGCGGSKVHSATKLATEDITLALAIFCKLFGVDPRSAAKHLDPVPRERFADSETWTRTNAAVVKRIRDDADGIRNGTFVLDQAEGWVSRIFGRGKRGPTAEETLSELERTMTVSTARKPADPARAKKLAEIRALVDESFEER